ncbi:DEHA2C17578p [Debaryomyces hansenii CBS767]|uniref:DEHA2C17578p n=1 Tax=Debaryomyces hansenii (strain ATCC 36239 / CBS 767 / BCRC 21394 / JCM 1990 / NBRC 0083 / IGC 2968) TaxID=284592 RepID=Q6BTL3_DEBHA|nr:DEHA2C17578p [Debaryomyces hansenii CBS767]CAG86538.2 DEHA2C17578p [Debaryomyces hansenii CBS767]|eukprot:XP_458456.2 DEHA2C17578p [Debaryomyces hansenii CBS767]
MLKAQHKSNIEKAIVIDKDFVGVLRSPDFLFSSTPYKDHLSPPTQKVVLVIPGEDEDYNSTRIKNLASVLSSELGLYSLRIKIPYDESKRSNWSNLEKGVDYIDVAVKYIANANKEVQLNLWSIIGYFDGAAMMFAWVIKQNDLYYSKCLEDRKKAIIVPNLINCCSKFYSNAFKSNNKTLFSEELEEYEYMYASVRPEESKTDIKLDFSKLCQLTNQTSVLSMYGSRDDDIGLGDCGHFTNLLNRGRYSHHLTFIPNADRYFHDVSLTKNNQLQKSSTEDLATDRIDLNNTAHEVIIDYLRPENEIQRFFSISLQGRGSSRWRSIQGISNFRDIGGWRINSPRSHDIEEYLYVKPNTIFRCATMDNISRDSGLEKLRDLGINTIFDFRTKSEAKRCVKDEELSRFGLRRIHCPFDIEEKRDPKDILGSFTNLLTSWYTYTSVYENMLVNSTDVYKKVFEFIRDEVSKGKKFVFHCSAGKDRTGIVCMLILLFMGVNKNIIAREYSLTAVGLKPEFENIRKKYLAGIGIFQKHETYAEFESNLKQGRDSWSVEKDGFDNLVSSRCETMLATLSIIDRKFGGIENYLKTYVGLTEDDLKTIYFSLIQSENTYVS